jgi:hypothetical protein
MLSINATSLVGQVIRDYNVWRDWQQFISGHNHLGIEISDQGIPCFLWGQLQQINSCESQVVAIDSMTEGWHCAKVFRKYNVDKHYVIFSSGWWDKKQVNLPISYDLVYYPYWLMEMVDVSFSPHRFCFHQDRHYSFEHKSYVFTSIIGGRRPERDQLVSLIQSKVNNLDYCLKYAGQWLRLPPSDVPDIMDTTSHYDSHAQLNTSYHYHNQHALYSSLLNISYFNLVVETNIDMDQHSWFLTEKTLKAMLCGCPFVIAATPWFLRRLRDMGFRTYQDIWDESYDEILDTSQRMCAIVDLCQELSKLNWAEHRRQLIEIRNHNFANLCNLGKVADQSFRHLETIMSTLSWQPT